MIALVAAALASAQAAHPPSVTDLPTEAADHVVVMESRTARRTITRSGAWVRDETVSSGGTYVQWSDFSSGTSYEDGQSADFQMLRIRRNSEGTDERTHVPTGRRHTIAGERCEIWRVSRSFPIQETCLTADGVMLASHYSNDRADGYRAVSVDRRPVPAEAARPPAALLDLPLWREGLPSRPGGPDYEVRLRSETEPNGSNHDIVVRQHGSLISVHHPTMGRLESLQMANDVASFSYWVVDGGRVRDLTIMRLRAAEPEGPEYRPAADRPPGSALGRSCRWHEPFRRGLPEAYSFCLADDGVPLMMVRFAHWVPSVTYRAVSVSRRPLTDADFAPPPELRDWATWGATPAD